MEALKILPPLCQWTAGLTFEQIPEAVVKMAKRSIVDTFAVGVAGSSWNTILALKKSSRDLYPGLSADCLDFETSLSPVGAALVNGAACHVLDYDDTFYPGVLHPSTVVFPSALAVAQSLKSDGQALLTAFIVGIEAECILGKIVKDTLYNQGWFPTVILGVVGSAIAASHLLKLSPIQTRHAVSIAFSQSSLLQKRGTPIRPYLVGRVAAIGVESAYLAQAGIHLNIDAFDHASHQIFSQIDPNLRFDISPIKQLGKTWSFIEPGLALKRYPVCSSAHAASEALENLIQQYKLLAAEIQSIDCEVTPMIYNSLDFEQPQTPTEAQFSLQFALASLLTYGELTPLQLNASILDDPVLQENMKKVTMGLGLKHLNPNDYPEATQVTITLKNGKTISQMMKAYTGMPNNPMSEQQLYQKFAICCKHLNYYSLWHELLGFDRIIDINQFIKMNCLNFA
jgi:2-methylcitrate dehydratase PrpD